MVTKKKEGFQFMRKHLNILFKYSVLTILIIFGLITIIGTGGDDDKSGHTANIEGEWDFTYGWDGVVGRSDPQRFVFTQDGKNVTFTGTFVTSDRTVYDCVGEGTINGDELEITAWNDDVDINLIVYFYTGLIDDLETSIIGLIEGGNGISWYATWGVDNSAAGIWSADKCGT
jgi:hypothetical protein